MVRLLRIPEDGSDYSSEGEEDRHERHAFENSTLRRIENGTLKFIVPSGRDRREHILWRKWIREFEHESEDMRMDTISWFFDADERRNYKLGTNLRHIRDSDNDDMDSEDEAEYEAERSGGSDTEET